MSETFSPQITEHQIDPAKAREAYDRAVSGRNNESAPRPRMTPAQQEAMQDFAIDSQHSVDEAYTEALKEHRKHDIWGYTDLVSSLAGQEADGTLDTGRFYRNRLLRENVQTSVEEKLDDAAQTAKVIGRTALHHSKVVSVGIYTASKNAADKKLFKFQAKRSYKKHTKQTHKEELRMGKAFDKQVRKQASSERWSQRRERLAERTINPARRLGERAISLTRNLYILGLEQSDPNAAAEYRNVLADRTAEKRQQKLATAMEGVDMTIQSPTVLELLRDEQFKPVDPIETDTELGFISSVFTNEQVPDTEYAVYYDQQDGGQIMPVLLGKEKGGEWIRANGLLPDEFAELTSAEKTAYKQASDILEGSTDVKAVNDQSFSKLLDSLTFRKAEPKVSEFRKKREEIIKAKREAELRAEAFKNQAQQRRDNRRRKGRKGPTQSNASTQKAA